MLAGRTADVAAALAVIAELGPDLGLELNLVKNEAVFFWDDTPDPFPKEVERFRDGFELLGSPIGDAAFCRKHMGKFNAKDVAHTLGPLLFSLVIQKLIAAFTAKCPGLALNLWYLDDGVIAADLRWR